MNRTSLEFLQKMFAQNDISSHHITIINQTQSDAQLASQSSNIKVINSKDFGLSKSRNLALKNATKKIVLIADDDAVFLKDFSIKIIDAYNANPKADFICFQTQTHNQKLYRTYPKGVLTKTQLNKVLSIEMTFKRDFIQLKNLEFDTHFGLGAQFSDTENVHFLHKMYELDALMIAVPAPIVLHDAISSSDAVASARLMYARGASFYKRYGEFAYFWILKYGFFLWRKGFVSFSKLKPTLKPMFQGLQDYKVLIKK